MAVEKGDASGTKDKFNLVTHRCTPSPGSTAGKECMQDCYQACIIP